jgi:hypothetical protein
VGRGRVNEGGEGEGGNTVDGLHIHIRNRMMKPLAVALLNPWGGDCRVVGGDGGGHLTNRQCKLIHNWHSELPCTRNIC